MRAKDRGARGRTFSDSSLYCWMSAPSARAPGERPAIVDMRFIAIIENTALRTVRDERRQYEFVRERMG